MKLIALGKGRNKEKFTIYHDKDMTAVHKYNCSKLTLTINVHCGKWAKVDEICIFYQYLIRVVLATFQILRVKSMKVFLVLEDVLPI